MYELSGVIAGYGLLCACTAENIPVAVLRDGLGLVAAEDVLPDRDPAPGTPSARREPGAPPAVVSPVFEAALALWSRRGPVAYVEAEFFGGTGFQAAAVWRDGVRAWGPVHDEQFTDPRTDWPINRALASLGARQDDRSGASPVYLDLFHRAGLGWERSSEEWRAVGRADRESGYAAALDHREEGFRAEAEHARRRQADELPDVLDGRTIMEILGVAPGPVVGAASRHLKELAREGGALPRDEAVAALRSWAHTGRT
ncbi:hypothetical protein [Yinghuangia soli]|uniref:Uncharacterized protein n=1 Tax=Yinghuangia soli TaxID=2908204 RepID=A0AA41U0V5_9ACTN|nr:hypothetical protein [Yinghuangia soli]MCF2528870.1 hypothetical protein [Yinghuangia soli]